MGESEKLAKLFRRLLIAALIVCALVFGAHLFFDLLLPFTAAFFAASLIAPLSKKIGKKTKLSLPILRLITLFLLVGALAFLLIFGSIRLFREAKDFFLSFYDSFDALMESLFSFLERLKEKLPVGEGISTESIASLLRDGVKNAMTTLSARSAEAAATLAAKLPSLLFSLLIFLLALFYFSLDYDRMTAYLHTLIPPTLEKKLERFKMSVSCAVKGYFRAYFLLFLITFAELFPAFLILRVEYAALLALTAAALDILPAVGVGILLLPWSAMLFISGNTARAVALLVIYLAVTLLRQIIEPHILGAQFGLHPLASLASLYLGFRLFGILGILLAPFAALAVARLLAFWREHLQKERTHDP